MPGSVTPINRNFASYQAITANGTYLTISRNVPVVAKSGTVFSDFSVIDEIAYEFVTDSSVTAGTAQFQFLGFDGTWRNGPSATTLTLTASTTFMGSWSDLGYGPSTGLCPVLGVRLVISGMSAGTIPYAHIIVGTRQ